MTNHGLANQFDEKVSWEEQNSFVRLIAVIRANSKILLPLFYISLMAVLIIYNVENPTDSMTARMLSYSVVFKMLQQHTTLVVFACSAAILTSIPLAILITRPKLKKYAPLFDNPVNVAQTVPSLAIIAIFYTYLDIGFQTALFALWLYSLLPILRNTSIGIQNIEPEIIEAARGMGMRNWRILVRIELPLALPIIMSGIRTSIVVCTGAAALSTFIGAGGLGDLIVTGLSLVRYQIIYVGAILCALLAILIDNLLGSLELYLKNR